MSNPDQNTPVKESPPRERVRLQVPSHPKYVAMVRDFIYKLSLQNGLSKEEAFDFKLLCGEALANIIQHAYLDRHDRPIFIEFLMFNHYAELRFRDMGTQHSISPGQARDLSDYREKGLGLFLISKLSDYHYFDQSFKTGTLLVVKKRLSK